MEPQPEPVHTVSQAGVHESPWVMLTPLVILALLATFGGFFGVPDVLGGHNEIEHWLAPLLSPAANGGPAFFLDYSAAVERTLALVSVLTALAGAGVAYLFYFAKRGTAAQLARRFAPIYTLVDNKFYVDQIYQNAIVTPLLMVSRLFVNGLFDKLLVNGFGTGAAAGTRGLGLLANRVQSGNIRSYAGWLALGAAAVIAIMLFTGTHLTH